MLTVVAVPSTLPDHMFPAFTRPRASSIEIDKYLWPGFLGIEIDCLCWRSVALSASSQALTTSMTVASSRLVICGLL